MLASQYAAYQTVQAKTADPGRIVVMLFEGAERFLHEAQRALDRNDIAGFSYQVSRAHAVVTELASGLDRERGGEMSRNLGRLYDFMLGHLTQGLIAKKKSHLEQVAAVLKQLREGFEIAAQSGHRATA
jgi:flagellar protein FliS